MKKVLITTKYRGVFFGMIDENQDLTQETIKNIHRPVMVIKWRTEEGLLGLSSDFDTSKVQLSKEGSTILVLPAVTMVCEVSKIASVKIWKQ